VMAWLRSYFHGLRLGQGGDGHKQQSRNAGDMHIY
jgi:hypothetical protein